MTFKADFPETYKALSLTESFESTVEHIQLLEKGWLERSSKKESETRQPDGVADGAFDVVLAGGGLSILFALLLARRGLKVAVLDARKIGAAHREWNISHEELQAFVKAGVFSQPEIDQLINLRYERGIVRFHGGVEHSVTGVLDCAIDAQLLLDKLREKLENEEVHLLEYHVLEGFSLRKSDLLLLLSNSSKNKSMISCRLLLDGRGAMSTNSEFDIVCPTVGGVLSNLEVGTAPDQVDTKTGEILISLEGVENGKQHIWEGFPTNDEMMTTYLFYYCDPVKVEERPLFNLYERFFRKLSTYKKGRAKVVKPTYGFIPGRTRLNGCSLSSCDRIYLVGDAAGLHSPLTFCGFGSIVRTFQEISEKLYELVTADLLDQKSLNKVTCRSEGLRVMGGLALMMVADRMAPDDNPQLINELLNDAFSCLASKGEPVYRDFMKDRISFSEFLSFMLEVSSNRPSVWMEVARRMSPGELKQYFIQLTKFGMSEFKVDK